MNRLALIAVTGALSLMLTACGDNSKPAETTSTVTTETSAPASTDAPKAQDQAQPAAQPEQQTTTTTESN